MADEGRQTPKAGCSGLKMGKRQADFLPASLRAGARQMLLVIGAKSKRGGAEMILLQ